MSNVKIKDVLQALKQKSLHFSPASVHDDAEVLLEKLHKKRGMLMLTDDAVGLLETECFCILSQVANENNSDLQKGVSSVNVHMSCSNGMDTM
eukprot:12772362-Ditylum_brightwellii.AAC.1